MYLSLNLAKSKSGQKISQVFDYHFPDELLKEYGYETKNDCKLELSYTYFKDYVLVEGQGSVSLTGSCYRCGEKAEDLVTFTFEEKFLPANVSATSNSESDEYFYLGDKIDITKMIEDNFLTSLPSQFLCKQDCQGICPQCFANLNTQKCACKPLINNSFACLNDIKID